MPTWSIVHSRHWKMQIPYLARHCRVLTFDGRGNGRSDRPSGPEAYREEEFAADAIAVMDATATDRVILVVTLARRGTIAARRGEPPGAGRQDGVHRAGATAATGDPRLQAMRDFDEPRETTRLGAMEPSLLGRALRGLPRVLLLAVLHRAALHEAARGLRRLGARDGRRDTGRDPAGAAAPTRRACARSSRGSTVRSS